MQTAAITAAGIDATYETVDVAATDLDAVIELLRKERVAGNVTIPHKEAVAERCDQITALARDVGAVNTFWFEPDGTLVGDNTDVGGFDLAARVLLEDGVASAHVVLVGAGGAAAAVCEAVRLWPGAQITIAARTRARAATLAARYPTLCSAIDFDPALRDGEFREALSRAQLVVNATPLGLAGAVMPVEPAQIVANCAVLDLSYRRGRTPWISACRARGLRAEDGLPMLVEQGALAFERWFGVPADRVAMWEAVK